MMAGNQACAEKQSGRFKTEDRVGPHIRLEHRLAVGGMAEIWVGRHQGLAAKVAVKFLADELRHDQLAVERFRREAKAAAGVPSPHVVRHFDVGVLHDGTPYIVMELLEGETVRERLDGQGPLDLATTAQIVTQVARALEAAHTAGIVHRDIKPDNIHITDGEDGPFVRVLDFGVAVDHRQKRLSRITLHGSIVGTPCYLSRDQLTGGECSKEQLDLWALAVVAYEALTGELPFVGETIDTLSLALARGRFPAASTLRPELEAEVDAWFRRAFDPDPTKRFASARELASTFAELVPPASLATTVRATSGAVWRAPAEEPPASLNPTFVSQPSEPVRPKRTAKRMLVAIVIAAGLGFIIGAENASDRARVLAGDVTHVARNLRLASSAELTPEPEAPPPAMEPPPPPMLGWTEPAPPAKPVAPKPPVRRQKPPAAPPPVEPPAPPTETAVPVETVAPIPPAE